MSTPTVAQAMADLEVAKAEARAARWAPANERERTRMAVVRAEGRLADARWAAGQDQDGAA